jgi:hypothetical protein
MAAGAVLRVLFAVVLATMLLPGEVTMVLALAGFHSVKGSRCSWQHPC